MFNVGGGELVVVLILGLILLGPDRLPNAARQLGKHLETYRRLREGISSEFRDAMDLAITGDGRAPAATAAASADVADAAADRRADAPADAVTVNGPVESFA